MGQSAINSNQINLEKLEFKQRNKKSFLHFFMENIIVLKKFHLIGFINKKRQVSLLPVGYITDCFPNEKKGSAQTKVVETR